MTDLKASQVHIQISCAQNPNAGTLMKKPDAFEKEILDAYEKGELKSTSPSKATLAKFKAAATATFRKKKGA
jgi:hypothetical protein